MGAGDWLMATAQVKRLFERLAKPIAVIDRAGRHQWHEVFENNPKIARSMRRDTPRLINAGGVRPYIASKTATRWTWKRWQIEPGEMFFTAAEMDFAAPYAGRILIEPTTKVEGSNKAWISTRWQELVERGGDFVQVGIDGTRALDGVQFVETPTFRHGCAVLAVSRAFVGTEGGLHHAAAALGVPAVVLFSEFISPEFTGYATHRNLRHAGGSCGSRLPCNTCRESMEAITVDEVFTNLEQIL